MQAILSLKFYPHFPLYCLSNPSGHYFSNKNPFKYVYWVSIGELLHIGRTELRASQSLFSAYFELIPE
jgi:hypothetical protein